DGYHIYSGENNSLPDNYNTITNNIFNDGYSAIDWDGGYNNKNEQSLVIEGNIFKNQYEEAIQVGDINNVAISNNKFYTDENNTNTEYYGIYLYGNDYMMKEFTIANNHFNLYNAYAAIYLENGEMDLKMPMAVKGSVVPETPLANAIEVEPSSIYNNIIIINKHDSDDGVYGIYTGYSRNINIVNNSIHVFGDAINTYVNGIYLSGNSIKVIGNNIKVNLPNSFDCYPMYLEYPGVVSQMDYNNYYNSNGFIINLDEYSPYNYSTIEAWYNETGLDQNSLAVDPMFIADTILIPCNNALDNKGQVQNGFEEDFYGMIRPVKGADIGAIEFATSNNINLPAEIELCREPIVLNPGFTSGVYQWSTGATSPTITVSSLGSYSVTVSSVCGVVNASTEIVANSNPTTAEFEILPLQEEGNYLMMNKSDDADSYYWNFGDGTTSTEVSPVINYAQPGYYDVKLVAYGECEDDSVTKSVDVLTSLEDIDGGLAQ
ncbi:MAG: PKD domain-containing protein, partial [Bacteroidales bacterium]|nr:PKD domain-containing protein [Bacteroidales bacterium]